MSILLRCDPFDNGSKIPCFHGKFWLLNIPSSSLSTILDFSRENFCTMIKGKTFRNDKFRCATRVSTPLILMLQVRSGIGITVYSTDDRRICFSLIRDRFLVQLDLDSSSLPMIAKNKFSTVERERERSKASGVRNRRFHCFFFLLSINRRYSKR